MNDKKIAVFIPCYNAAETIGETLASVKKSIAHFAMDVPVYIYDDGSKDDSLSIAGSVWQNENGLTIKKNERNLGERQTTNNAFQYFYNRYDWVFIIHADDIAKPEWLSSMYESVKQVNDQEYFTVWSSFDSLDHETGKISNGDNTGEVSARQRTASEKKYYLTKLSSSWHLSGAAINVNIFERLGGFDISLAQLGDTDFFVRGLLAEYRDLYISRTLTFYRVVKTSVSSISLRTNRDIKEALYIISKFRNKLNSSELRTLYKNITELSSRRACKWLLKSDFKNFLFCSKVASNAFINYFRSYGKIYS